ncbi:pentapeptide repeat-containing protein [Candidatus Woesearchaeota archaeon]|nr:pentapeptide repeat-containing protein [Candidatus Woesearchaeota archaeon]
MAEEQTIKNEIAAMEGWAIDAKGKADSADYKGAISDLKKLNLQGRRLEWRGGKYGLKHLPDLAEVEQLKERIASARAAAQNAIGAVEKMTKLGKGKTPAEEAAIKRKEGNLRKDAGKNITILIQVLKLARATAEKEPWMDLSIIVKNKKVLAEFLRGAGYYKGFSQEERMELERDYIKFTGAKLDLSKADLSEADLRKMSLIGADLSEAWLRKADLSEAWIMGADLSGAYLKGANLREAKLWKTFLFRADLRRAYCSGADFMEADLSEADLSGAIFVKANFDKAKLNEADLSGANLKDVKNLTAKQLRSAKNWDKAKNIPPKILEELRQTA